MITSKTVEYPVSGAGLGLRRSMMGEEMPPGAVDFLEVAPENWINVGGRYGRWLREYTERYPFVIHGLSLSIGSPSPLDLELVKSVKGFIREHGIRCYSEHLSYCSDHGHLYDLLPIPFTPEAVTYVAGRIRQVQDVLGQRIAMENVSYYAAPAQEMTELEFINAVLEEADCDLLLDVNNIYVNAINHRYDPVEFLRGLPGARIRYAHVAGHFNEAEDLMVDTHGAPVIDPVWELLQEAYAHFGVFPTLLERDFNIPPLRELVQEVGHVRQLQAGAAGAAMPESSASAPGGMAHARAYR
ncbi:HvfB family MNIO-type RiPP peptide maturase [Microbulbifer sediminum]|uniref:HvfB family MNIO-type RiPP peptide maturase n=1 Tax=Microbulbifer sediminum TaxID=2904250 RepID=UPI001F42B3EF|nr:DUF692 domain-containing protein [Microbulbifer sediminum]